MTREQTPRGADASAEPYGGAVVRTKQERLARLEKMDYDTLAAELGAAQAQEIETDFAVGQAKLFVDRAERVNRDAQERLNEAQTAMRRLLQRERDEAPATP